VLSHTFVIILEVFAEYLVREKGMLPESWAMSLPAFGRQVEDLLAEAKRRANGEGEDQ
jgi:hypothetical protein